MLNFLNQVRDEFILKVIYQECEEVIPMDEITELRLTTTPKESFGLVRSDSEIIGNVYEYGTRDESRQKCIEQAQKVTQSQYPEGLIND